MEKGLVQELEEIISGDFDQLPKVHTSSQNKTISVKNLFPLIPFPTEVCVKVIAKYDEWIGFEEDPEKIDFDSIPFPKKPIELLRRSFESDPQVFGLTFFSEFVFHANFDNPKHPHGKKPRGVKSYFFEKNETAEAKMSTLHLYVFIKHWVQERAKNPNIKLPAEYKRIETILGERFFPNEVHIPVMKLIDRYYGSDLMERLENDDYLKTSFERIFLTNYVYRGNSLAFFEKFYSRYKFLPLKINELNGENTHPLSKYSPLFHPLIKILE